MFQPTHVENTPAVCYCCGFHSAGVGIGGPKDDDPRFLCTQCVAIMQQLRHIRRLDPYELEALDGGVDAVGDYIETIGGKTELADYDDLERRMLVKAAWRGCADRLREVVRKGQAPF